LWKAVRRINGKYRKSHLIKRDVVATRTELNSRLPEAKRKTYHELVLYSLTRWIGSYYELKSFNEHRDVFQDLMNTSWKDRLVLPASFFAATEELESLLELLKKPIDALQYSSVPIVSWQLIIAKQMRRTIKKYVCGTLIGKSFQETLLASLDQRLDTLVADVPDWFDDFMQFKTCEFLDPTTAKFWGEVTDDMTSAFLEICLALNEKFQLNLSKLIKKRSLDALDQPSEDCYADFYALALGMPPKKQQAQPTVIEIAEKEKMVEIERTEKSGSKKKRKTSKNSAAAIEEAKNTDSAATEADLKKKEKTLLTTTLRGEFEEYRVNAKKGLQQLKCLEWWKKHQCDYPLLARVASVLLAQPVGTPDVERRCSEAGNIITKLRNRLGHEKSANLFFIHGNGEAEWARNAAGLRYLYNSVATKK
jgi:hypothetical protein